MISWLKSLLGLGVKRIAARPFYILKVVPQVFNNDEFRKSGLNESIGVNNRTLQTNDLSVSQGHHSAVSYWKIDNPPLKVNKLPDYGTFIVGESVEDLFEFLSTSACILFISRPEKIRFKISVPIPKTANTPEATHPTMNHSLRFASRLGIKSKMLKMIQSGAESIQPFSSKSFNISISGFKSITRDCLRHES